MQSASASPGIAIAPRSVVQVHMPDDGSTGSGAGEGEAVSMVSAGEDVNLGGMCALVEVSRLLTTMRTMSRSLR